MYPEYPKHKLLGRAPGLPAHPCAPSTGLICSSRVCVLYFKKDRRFQPAGTDDNDNLFKDLREPPQQSPARRWVPGWVAGWG